MQLVAVPVPSVAHVQLLPVSEHTAGWHWHSERSCDGYPCSAQQMALGICVPGQVPMGLGGGAVELLDTMQVQALADGWHPMGSDAPPSPEPESPVVPLLEPELELEPKPELEPEPEPELEPLDPPLLLPPPPPPPLDDEQASESETPTKHTTA